ncbi:MAG: arsenate reductase family protein [Rhodospirillaceae bacterium]
MAHVVFFEKPGCINNTRQKKLLAEAGHELEPKDLRSEPWTPQSLRPFFGDLPVKDWFNKAAPRVKSGAIRPESLIPAVALDLMIADPLLIRRPLMAVAGADGIVERRVGFDAEAVDAWVGLAPAVEKDSDLESCPREHGKAG